ncbi:MAG: 23S rRNA (guanosine(2251)-2'-O)-methyltransferase RlmB [Gammaproteobacteria bacterium]|nr:23S rRNA (guanosine(2251)-2'-O)-methyltransferase RlmB [Gammaproteobacteria bacterium]
MTRRTVDWIYGRHAVAALLDDDASGVLEIWLESAARGEMVDRVEATAREAGIAVQRVSRKTLDKHLGEVVHQGVAARYRQNRRQAPLDLDSVLETAADPALLLLLDEITDPHNLGACLRTAEAAGADAVITPRRRSAGIGPTVRKVASGAAGRVPFVQVPNLARAMARIAETGVTVVGAAPGARDTIYDLDLTGPVALVLGSEGQGLRRLTREGCTRLVGLPMAGKVESLNVSVAAGICMFEVVRQRRVASRQAMA